MKQSQRALETDLNDFSDRLEKHIDGYIEHVKNCLSDLVEGMIHDFKFEDTEEVRVDSEDIRSIFFTGKKAFQDYIGEFYSDWNEANEFKSIDHVKTDLESIVEEHDNHLRDDGEEDKIYAYDKLRALAMSYQLSDSQYHQTEILRLLEDEFGLNLIVAPAKCQ